MFVFDYVHCVSLSPVVNVETVDLLKLLLPYPKATVQNVYRRTIEMPQCVRIFKINCCLEVETTIANFPDKLIQVNILH